jgi:hypothetical protein
MHTSRGAAGARPRGRLFARLATVAPPGLPGAGGRRNAGRGNSGHRLARQPGKNLLPGTGAGGGRHIRRLAIAAAVPAVAGGLSLAAPDVALASTLTVTNCNGSGPGSLADAVTNASAGDTISFDSALSCPPASPIVLARTLGISDLTIDGPRAATMAVSVGGGSTGVLATSGQVSISGLTIEGSKTPTAPMVVASTTLAP